MSRPKVSTQLLNLPGHEVAFKPEYIKPEADKSMREKFLMQQEERGKW